MLWRRIEKMQKKRNHSEKFCPKLVSCILESYFQNTFHAEVFRKFKIIPKKLYMFRKVYF